LQSAGVRLFLRSDTVDQRSKLTTSELRSLVFGHKLQGHYTGYRVDADRFASVTVNGIANFFGSWGYWRDAPATIEQDQLCIRGEYDSACFIAYRNLGGSRAKLNEYLFFGPRGGVYAFSQVE